MTKTTKLVLTSEELRMIVIQHFGLNPGLCEFLELDDEPSDKRTMSFSVSLEHTEEVDRPWEKGSKERSAR